MRQWTSAARRAIALPGAVAVAIAWAAALAASDPALDDGQWVRPARDLASTRYSGLEQINSRNVARLRVAFTFSTGVVRGHEAAPIVAGNTMFIVGPYPNTLFALDLTRPGAPLKWTFDPKPDPSSRGVACCDLVNRGAVYADGRVFFNTLDNQTLAVDAKTGKELWRVKLGNIRLGESMTMAPLVVKDKVLVGNSGGEFGVRGWLQALDAATGRTVWKAFSTGPDKDVLIGAHFRPFYPQDRGKDLGVSSWPADAWKIGGGNVWAWISYDPELDLVIYGTGNPGPWNPEQRPGDNKWTAGVFARRADTGEAVWYYQYSPHDLHDYDGVNEHVLLDLSIGGWKRKLLVHPDRNGYVYLMDRTTGQVLSANPFVPITTSTGVDVQTGVINWNPRKDPRAGETVRNICPAGPGGKDWQPSAWSPRTGLLYIPHQNICQDASTSQVSYIAGTPYFGVDARMTAGPGGTRGRLTAWDPLTGRKAWDIPEFFPVWSGALATAGDVVFYGTMDGWFKAVHAKTGALLWKFKAASGIIGQPISYRGPDGNQYIAVLAGIGGWAGAVVSGNLDTRDGTAAGGWANAIKDLKSYTTTGGMLYVFALPPAAIQ
jgi:PQQ-dependent dehydrogenase (methanol/ethanol family)